MRANQKGDHTMTTEITRREVLKGSFATAGLLALGLGRWSMPALAQNETLVAFTDIPENMTFPSGPNAAVRVLDIRTIDGPFTPKDEFFALQHYGQPEIDPVAYRLKITGLVEREAELSLEDIRSMPSVEIAAGYECSGNSGRRIHGLASNGRWRGTRLRDVLTDVGVRPNGKEVVFFGADRGEEVVDFRGQDYTVEQQFGRSITLENAMGPDPLLAYELNGEPLTRHQGSPLRLLMPGWYGVANVKWIENIHVQDARYLGKFQARWYRTLKGETIDGEVKWKETEVSRMQLKSVIARVTRIGDRHRVFGFVLNDGTPLESVEVKIDDGQWQRATLDATNTQYSWKLFSYAWEGATPGEHTLVSRATDADGYVQPVEADLEGKLTFLEHNAQFPRTVMIS
jgi:DMSO/TMAO reductase YedYZ molybdopterin-dependent catalytic subunit